MDSRKLEIPGALLIETPTFKDERGSFTETFRANDLHWLTDQTFVQDNLLVTKQNALRGLHVSNVAQGKLIHVIQGTVYDVMVDLRKGPTFGKWLGFLLGESPSEAVYIPPGCAHGFLAVTDCVVAYKSTTYYYSGNELCLRYDDPDVGINWPKGPFTVSEKDQKGFPLEFFKGWIYETFVH